MINRILRSIFLCLLFYGPLSAAQTALVDQPSVPVRSSTEDQSYVPANPHRGEIPSVTVEGLIAGAQSLLSYLADADIQHDIQGAGGVVSPGFWTQLLKPSVDGNQAPIDAVRPLLEGFCATLAAFAQMMQEHLQNSACWLDHESPQGLQDRQFVPFVQRLQPRPARFAIVGDLHGGFQSLVNLLREWRERGFIDNDLNIINDNFYALFLGDYSDRGPYSLEVLCVLMLLKLKNPDHVILLRGNHENLEMNTNYDEDDICLEEELSQKFGYEYGSPELEQLLENIDKLFYNNLSLALYLGNVLCCHGSIDPVYNPRPLIDCPDHEVCYDVIRDLPANTVPDWFSTLDADAQRDMCIAGLQQAQQKISFDVRAQLTQYVEACEAIAHSASDFWGYFYEQYVLGQAFGSQQSSLEKQRQKLEQGRSSFQAAVNEFFDVIQIGQLQISESVECAGHINESSRAVYENTLALIREYLKIFDRQPGFKYPDQEQADMQSAYRDASCRLSECSQQLGLLKKKFQKNYNALKMLNQGGAIAPQSMHILFGGDEFLGRFGHTIRLCDRDFVMGDFMIIPDEPNAIECRQGCRFTYSQRLAKHLLNKDGLFAVLRAHQHGDMLYQMVQFMGILGLWDIDNDQVALPVRAGAVYTFMIATSAGCAGLDDLLPHDPCSFLVLNETDPDTWTLEKKWLSNDWYLMPNGSDGSACDGESEDDVAATSGGFVNIGDQAE